MTTIARVKGWGDFQHYKDRSPPWIKLHRKLLDNYDFAMLPVASKALAPLLWLVAAETVDGTVQVDPDWLAFRVKMSVEEVQAGLPPLFDKGFLELVSGLLAPCKQPATPEREAEAEAEGKKTLARPVARFAEFWDLYPMKKGRKAAEAKWKARNLDAIADRILADVRTRMAKDRQWLDGFIPHGSTYVNGAGWEDAIDESPAKVVLASNGRPEIVCSPAGGSPAVKETPQRTLDAMIALFEQRISLGQMTKDQAREQIKPYQEAARAKN